mmetsp:Transcript_3613/g.5347  ORF Transcript_3613/g.5347 Transcript_3613/m.5347 type:complete len:143 (-) Transcript_3613:112-540(-)
MASCDVSPVVSRSVEIMYTGTSPLLDAVCSSVFASESGSNTLCEDPGEISDVWESTIGLFFVLLYGEDKEKKFFGVNNKMLSGRKLPDGGFFLRKLLEFFFLARSKKKKKKKIKFFSGARDGKETNKKKKKNPNSSESREQK